MNVELITQDEFDHLMALEKVALQSVSYKYPDLGGTLTVPLESVSRDERFTMNIGRGYVKVSKVSFHKRVRSSIGLVRVDLDGSPHKNPDGQLIDCPHIHLYREGYELKWAEPLPTEHFKQSADAMVVFDELLNFCNVTRKPILEWRLDQ